MKKTTILSLCLAVSCFSVVQTRDYDIKKTETIRKQFTFPETGKGTLLVDTVFGSIHVEGHNRDQVEVTVHKTIQVEDQAAYDRALNEVSLDMTIEDNILDVYVDGPFRCQNRRPRRRDPRYRVVYDFEIRTPRRTTLDLQTVTEGDIRVRNIQGDFDIHNVNGEIDVNGIKGSGTAHTVNGKVDIVFDGTPSENCSFKTINGEINLHFPSTPSADFRLKTFHGDMYSDFNVDYLPAEPVEAERDNGRYVYKSNRFFRVRTGKGGPDIKLETLNGDILISKR
jgi:hypothetical protein